jgi:hypothetical protein
VHVPCVRWLVLEILLNYFLGGMDRVMWLGGTRREVIGLACVF